MAKNISLPAYAKLNLALRVTGRRPDGFHSLQTLFERIDLCDELTFQLTANGANTLICDHPAVPDDDRNLVVKAARMLQAAFKVKQGAKIRIRKRIPVAAGLAGGSSDGAAALMGLNWLWRLDLAPKDLVPFAKRLGSDVAFFLYDTPWALGTERGDKIKPLAIPAKLWHILITPKVPVLTKDVYGTYAVRFSRRNMNACKTGDFSLTKLDADVNILLRSLRKNDIIRAGARLFNDLEPAILTLRPGLLRLKERLREGDVLGVSFSGSGPSIFALTENQKNAERLREQFSRTYRQVFVVRTR
jgi:4-diphosphocytidyl-2-C-methyl-D-erythritol kinase